MKRRRRRRGRPLPCSAGGRHHLAVLPDDDGVDATVGTSWLARRRHGLGGVLGPRQGQISGRGPGARSAASSSSNAAPADFVLQFCTDCRKQVYWGGFDTAQAAARAYDD